MEKLLALSLLIFCTSCSTLKVDLGEISKIKRAAVVGFTLKFKVDQEIHDRNRILLEGGDLQISSSKNLELKGDLSKILSKEQRKKRADLAKKSYQALLKFLERSMGWRMVSSSEMAQSDLYDKTLAESTEGFFSRGFHQSWGFDGYAPGIVPARTYKKLDQKTLGQLNKDFQTDTLLVLTITVHLDDSGVAINSLGLGIDRIYTSAQLRAWRGNNPMPIWEDLSSEGAPTEQGIRQIAGFGDMDRLHSDVVPAAYRLYTNLIEKIKPH